MKSPCKDEMLDWILLFAVSITYCARPTLQQGNQTNTTSTTISPSTKVVSTVKPIPTPGSEACAWGKDVWNICWLNSPPYVFSNENKTDVTGILVEVFTKGLGICGCSTKLNFTLAKNYDDFLNCSNSNDIDIALPFPEKKATLRRWLYTIVDSPNIYLLLNRKVVETEAKDRVLSQFFSVWTIAVLTVLLAIIFGIIVWFLDMKWNNEEFPSSFIPGSLEGVWWSFVTLTTVGYGDKTPKFPMARILAVVWMFVGMGMISLLTATMTKALTTAVFDYQTYIQSKNKIGVLNHSYTFNEAVKKGLKTQVFSNLEEMYTTLDDPNNKSIGGILVDIFVATYVRNNRERFKLTNTLYMAKSYDVVYPLAFYLAQGVTQPMMAAPEVPLNHFSYCFSKTFLISNQQIPVYEIVDKYIQLRPSGSSSQNQEAENAIKFEIDLFNQTENTFIVGVKILSGVLGFLILLGFLWQIVYFRRSKSESFMRNSKGGDIESIDMTTHNHRDAKKINVIMERLHEVDKALNTLSEFKEILEQYKRDANRYDARIVNGTTQSSHAGASTNKGFTSVT